MAMRDNSSHLLSQIITRLEEEGSDTSAFTTLIEHKFIPALRDGLRAKNEVRMIIFEVKTFPLPYMHVQCRCTHTHTHTDYTYMYTSICGGNYFNLFVLSYWCLYPHKPYFFCYLCITRLYILTQMHTYTQILTIACLHKHTPIHACAKTHTYTNTAICNINTA